MVFIITLLILVHVSCELTLNTKNTDNMQGMETLLLTFLEDQLHDERCVFVSDSENTVPTGVLEHRTDTFFPNFIIQAGEINQTQNILFMHTMNRGCSSFLLGTQNISRTLNFIYRAVQTCVQRRTRRYILIYHGKYHHIETLNKSLWLKLFPYIYIVVPVSNNSTSGVSFDILGQTEIHDHKERKFKVIARWMENKFMSLNIKFKSSFFNLGGETLKMLMMPYSPYTFIKNNKPDGTDYRIVLEFSRKYNFTWNVHFRDLLFGKATDNISSLTYLGMLKNVEYTTGVPGLYLSLVKYNIFYLSVPYMQSGVAFLTPKPDSVSYLWEIFEPLTTSAWFGVLALVLSCSLSLYTFSSCQVKLFPRRKSGYVHMLYSFVHSVSILVGLAAPSAKGGCVKHIVICYYLTSLIMVTFYNSNLVSFLTIPVLQAPIDTVEQLVASGLEWGTNDIVWKESFEGSTDAYTREIGNRYSLFNDTKLLEKHAGNSELAVLVEKLASGQICGADFLSEALLSKLHLMKENVFNSYIVFAFQKGSQLVHTFNNFLVHLVESGIVIKWEKEIVGKYRSNMYKLSLNPYQDEEESFQPLIIQNINGIFVILLIGLAMSLVCFVAEIIWKSR